MKKNNLDKILDEVPEEQQKQILKSLQEPTIVNFEMMAVAGCTDREIAGMFKFTQSELEIFIGLILQDDPDFNKRIENIRSSRHAISKLGIVNRILKGDTEMMKWDLEKTNREYNQKILVDNTVSVPKLTDEEKKILDKLLPPRPNIIDVK